MFVRARGLGMHPVGLGCSDYIRLVEGSSYPEGRIPQPEKKQRTSYPSGAGYETDVVGT